MSPEDEGGGWFDLIEAVGMVVGGLMMLIWWAAVGAVFVVLPLWLVLS